MTAEQGSGVGLSEAIERVRDYLSSVLLPSERDGHYDVGHDDAVPLWSDDLVALLDLAARADTQPAGVSDEDDYCGAEYGEAREDECECRRCLAQRAGVREVEAERDVADAEVVHWQGRFDRLREQFRELWFDGLSVAEWHERHCAAAQAAEAAERREAGLRARVEALHRPEARGPNAAELENYCQHCRTRYPCRTIAALTSEQGEGE